MRLDRCGTCRFWNTDYPANELKHEYGECRRRPPMPYSEVTQYSEMSVRWPSTRNDDWCGQWRVLLTVIPAPQPTEEA